MRDSSGKMEYFSFQMAGHNDKKFHSDLQLKINSLCPGELCQH